MCDAFGDVFLIGVCNCLLSLSSAVNASGSKLEKKNKIRFCRFSIFDPREYLQCWSW